MNGLDFNKLGVIILTQYRSGGTQLLSFLQHICEEEFGDPGQWSIEGELDSTLEDTNIYENAMKSFYKKDDNFRVYLLNNPIAILALERKKAFFKLTEDFNVICLSRLNTANGVLSLGLWEHIIQKGIFKKSPNIPDEDMDNLHKDLTSNPLGYRAFTLGYDGIVKNDGTKKSVNGLLQRWSYQDTLIRLIGQKFSLPQLFYEEYEQTPDHFIKMHLPDASDTTVERIKETYKYKIPYRVTDYRKYYIKEITKLLDQWEIKNL